MQLPNPLLQSVDPIDFGVRQRTIEHGEVIHVPDAGGVGPLSGASAQVPGRTRPARRNEIA
jgi:hypothetical protein